MPTLPIPALSQQEMLDAYGPWVAGGSIYQKQGVIEARPAVEGEVIVTVTGDGKETQNTANAGDYVVTNQTTAREQYIVPGETFAKKYEAIDNRPGWYYPKGRITVQEWPYDEQTFIAAWGQEMVIKKGDYLVRPVGGNEVYRIARAEFHQTYVPLPTH
jgi:hypothetical protein